MTTTPRLGLYLPPDENVDVTNHLSNQLQAIDNAFDAFVCTSTTHPSSGNFDGRLIYETDTGNLSYWDSGSSSWIVYSNGRKPLGRLGYITTSSASSSLAGVGEIGPYLAITFTAKKNREYVIHYSGTTDHVSGHNSAARWIVFRASTSGAVTTSSTMIHQNIGDIADNGTGLSVRQNTSSPYFPNINGSVTVGVFLRATAGTNTVLFNSASMQMFAVEDIGYKAA